MKAAGIQDLSIAERLQLVQDLWDSIAARPDAIGLYDAPTGSAGIEKRCRATGTPKALRAVTMALPQNLAKSLLSRILPLFFGMLSNQQKSISDQQRR